MHSQWPCESLQDLRGTSAASLEHSSPCPIEVEQCPHATLYVCGLFMDVSIAVAWGGGAVSIPAQVSWMALSLCWVNTQEYKNPGFRGKAPKL